MLQTYLGLIQGLIYIGTGIWPLLHMRSFEAVTGPKVDHWLVNTVGLLVTVIGMVILYSWWQGEFPTETVILAAGSAIALSSIEVIYASCGRISKVYLCDAAIEIPIAVLWFTTL